MILNVRLADATAGNLWATCFQEEAEQLLGMSAEELGEMFTNDTPTYVQFLEVRGHCVVHCVSTRVSRNPEVPTIFYRIP